MYKLLIIPLHVSSWKTIWDRYSFGVTKTPVRFADNQRTSLHQVRQRRTQANIQEQQGVGARIVTRVPYKLPLEYLHDIFVHWAKFCGGDDVAPPVRHLTGEDLLGEPGLGGIPPNDLAALENQIGEIVNG